VTAVRRPRSLPGSVIALLALAAVASTRASPWPQFTFYPCQRSLAGIKISHLGHRAVSGRQQPTEKSKLASIEPLWGGINISKGNLCVNENIFWAILFKL
jgi:hypothetical protein